MAMVPKLQQAWKGLLKWIERDTKDAMAVLCLLGAITALCLYVAYRRMRGSVEGFQDAEGFQELATKISTVPLMGMGIEQCPIIKKTLDMYRTKVENDAKPGSTASEEDKKVSRDILAQFETTYRDMNCEDYLKKLETGEIKQPQSSVDIFKEMNTMKEKADVALKQAAELNKAVEESKV